jgi:primosomal protein N''
MKPLELEDLDRALRAAVAEQDWERLIALDARLSAWLAGAPTVAERDALDRLRATYREVLAASMAAGVELEQRLALLSREREGQLAYAQASQWEGA